jgi:hypothetical protein
MERFLLLRKMKPTVMTVILGRCLWFRSLRGFFFFFFFFFLFFCVFVFPFVLPFLTVPSFVKQQACIVPGYVRSKPCYLAHEVLHLLMDDGSVVNPGFAGAFVPGSIQKEASAREGYGHLQPQTFENGLSTQERKNACEAWCILGPFCNKSQWTPTRSYFKSCSN